MYNVLLVDDEKYILTSLKASVDWQSQGFEICGEANDAQCAIALIDKLRPDLVVTDIRMPGMNGLEMVNTISQKYPDILFVMISGYADFQYVKKAITLSVVAYWLKPFDTDEINDTLSKCRKILDARLNGVGRLYQNHVISPQNVKNPIVRNALKLVNENFTVNYSVNNLAKRFSVNENYLGQLFKKEIGEPFTAYLTRLRLVYACTLLKNTDLSIKEISNKAGYADYFYFARLFKREYGITPSEYRDKNES